MTMLIKDKFNDAYSIEIYIVTRNREKILKQNLEYLRINNCFVTVIDGSIEYNHEPERLGMKYFHLPGETFITRVRKIADLIQSDYFLICADDDFLLIDGIPLIINELIKDKSLVAAQGRHMVLGSNDANKFNIYSHSYDKFDSLEIRGYSALRRLLIINSPPVYFYCYAVCRKCVIKNFHTITENLQFSKHAHTLMEPLFGIAVAISGGYKSINAPHLIRRPSVAHDIAEPSDILCSGDEILIQNELIEKLSNFIIDGDRSYIRGFIRACLDMYGISSKEIKRIKLVKRDNTNNITMLMQTPIFILRKVIEKISLLTRGHAITKYFFDGDENVYRLAVYNINKFNNFFKKYK